MRATLQKILSLLVARRWRKEFEHEADRVVERALDLRDIDGVRDLAEAYVLTVFPRAVSVNVPPDRLLLTGELNFNQLGPNNARLQRALVHAEPYMAWYADQLQREKMPPGGFGEQIYLAEDGGEFEPGTALAHVRSSSRAGVDTTVAGIGMTLNQLALHPARFSLLAEDAKMIRAAFDEGIRFESPAHSLYRTTVGSVELSGYALAADTKIAYYPGAANRDERFCCDLDRFDITRSSVGAHRAFGVAAMCASARCSRAWSPIAFSPRWRSA